MAVVPKWLTPAAALMIRDGLPCALLRHNYLFGTIFRRWTWTCFGSRTPATPTLSRARTTAAGGFPFCRQKSAGAYGGAAKRAGASAAGGRRSYVLSAVRCGYGGGTGGSRRAGLPFRRLAGMASGVSDGVYGFCGAVCQMFCRSRAFASGCGGRTTGSRRRGGGG